MALFHLVSTTELSPSMCLLCWSATSTFHAFAKQWCPFCAGGLTFLLHLYQIAEVAALENGCHACWFVSLLNTFIVVSLASIVRIIFSTATSTTATSVFLLVTPASWSFLPSTSLARSVKKSVNFLFFGINVLHVIASCFNCVTLHLH